MGHGIGGEGGDDRVGIAQAAANQGQGLAVTPELADRHGAAARFTTGTELRLELLEQLPAAAAVMGGG